jgi:hypothetical protein
MYTGAVAMRLIVWHALKISSKAELRRSGADDLG